MYVLTVNVSLKLSMSNCPCEDVISCSNLVACKKKKRLNSNKLISNSVWYIPLYSPSLSVVFDWVVQFGCKFVKCEIVSSIDKIGCLSPNES